MNKCLKIQEVKKGDLEKFASHLFPSLQILFPEATNVTCFLGISPRDMHIIHKYMHVYYTCV